jgi:hypothetical protein
MWHFAALANEFPAHCPATHRRSLARLMWDSEGAGGRIGAPAVDLPQHAIARTVR